MTSYLDFFSSKSFLAPRMTLNYKPKEKKSKHQMLLSLQDFFCCKFWTFHKLKFFLQIWDLDIYQKVSKVFFVAYNIFQVLSETFFSSKTENLQQFKNKKSAWTWKVFNKKKISRILFRLFQEFLALTKNSNSYKIFQKLFKILCFLKKVSPLKYIIIFFKFRNPKKLYF